MDEDVREQTPMTTMGYMAPEPPRTVGLQVFCHHSNIKPSLMKRPPVTHMYTVRVDLLSANATVYGYGDTPAEAFRAAANLLPGVWRGAVMETELPIMHNLVAQLLENESGQFKTTGMKRTWQTPQWAYEWPSRPMEDFDEDSIEH